MLLRALLQKPLVQFGLGFASVSASAMATSSTAAADVLMDPSVTDPKKAPNIYVFRAKNIDGEMVDLSAYRGHVCLIVNVASK